ncbi:hypothetical protein [Ferrovibrio sp.]|uniref:hypothetical protein n=1 Tax=Ferrovibrio sp. TaxID=1917215 RepID=UPI003D103393
MTDYWNLTQTWAWIRWRDPAKVAAFKAEGHIGLAEAMMFPDGTRIIEENHRAALLDALRTGRITTQGQETTAAALVSIAPDDWQRIEPVAPSQARHAVAGNRRVAWHGLRFDAAVAMRLWPPMTGVSLKI